MLVILVEEELDSAECYFTSDLGYSYDGEVNTDCDGLACMSWDHYLIKDLFVRCSIFNITLHKCWIF